MNSLIYTKAMAHVQTGVIRRCYCHNLWHDVGQRSMSSAVVGRRETFLYRSIDRRKSDVYGGGVHFGIRVFHGGSAWRGQESSSKVEKTVKVIKEQKEEKEKQVEVQSADVAEKSLVKKKTLWQKVKSEVLHYYHGFRLLGLDLKVSAKLIWRILQGKELSRREHRLLVKTTGDVFRLIPFSVFIIVPFMELLLPIAIKLFPGMLPSTFQTSSEKEDKLKQALKVKIEMAKFLQQTLDDMAVQSSEHKSEKAKEFRDFFYKVRSTGTIASNEEIMKFSKFFEDEITLDSLSRPQLVALCRVLDVQTLGTTNFLLFLLRMKLRSLAADDRLIEKEGIESLTRAELQQACRARGMRAYGLPDNRLREQLAQWLDLSLVKKVPPSLLLLSRALMVPETISMSDKLKATISALPDTVVARTQGAIGEKEGKLDHRTNIEIIKMEERKIEEERAEEKTVEPQPSIVLAHGSEAEKADEITTTDVKVLEQALDSIGKDKKIMSVEKEEIKELKEEMAEYQEDLRELYQIKAESRDQFDLQNIKVSKGAKRLFNKVNRMIGKMDAVLLELEQSEKQMKEKLEALTPEEKSEAKEVAELVRIDELVATIKQIQSVPDEHRLARITEILGQIDDDRDGAIKIEDVLKVVELIGKEDVKLNKKQLHELIDLMEKEEVLEVEDQIQKALKKDTQTKNNDGKQTKSQVPATPVTVEEAAIEKDLSEETSRSSSDKSFAAEDIEDIGRSNAAPAAPAAAVLKSKNEPEASVRNASIAPSVRSSSSKKAEGTKQL